MDANLNPEFSNLLENMLTNYEQLKDKSKINDLLIKEIENSKIYGATNQCRSTVEEISSTLGMIISKFTSLREGKKEGKSSEEWLVNDINTAISGFSEVEQSEIIRHIDQALKNNKSEYLEFMGKSKSE